MIYNGIDLVGTLIYYRNPINYFFSSCKTELLESPYNGPLSKYNDYSVSQKLIELFQSNIKDLIRYCHFPPSYMTEDFVKDGFVEQKNKIVIIKLEKNIDDQFALLKKNKRHDLVKAKKNNLVFLNGDVSHLNIYYQMLLETSKRLRISPLPRELIKEVFLLPENMRDIFFVSHNEEIICGLIILKYNKKAIYWNSVSKEKARNLQGTNFALWKTIENLVNQNYNTFDLLGAEKDGLQRFKKGFGGEVKTYSRLTKKNILFDYILHINKKMA